MPTETKQVPEQTMINNEPVTPVVMVGDQQHDEAIVMRRIFVRASLSTPERGEFMKLTSLEEIPLLRKLYSQYGGSVKIVGGLEHPSYGRYTVQGVNQYTLRNIITYLKRTYNNVLIQKRLHQFFDDVFGSGENCQLIPKMQGLVEEWNGSLEAEDIEALLQRHFPHVSARSQDDILSVPGLDGLTAAPKIGARASSVPAVTQEANQPPVEADGIDISGLPTLPASPDTLEQAGRLNATILTGSPGPDPDLAAFLMDSEKTSGNPLLENQAWGVASLVVEKPPQDWDSDDYKGLPGLTKKNHARISRLVGDYLSSKMPEGGQDEAGESTSEDDDSMFG